ncbi:hypothetical protein [Spongiibacter sp.]|uniref:hypothetical protein n=1 Tax=Spongiibacter sp. TaxID=2024860 RepID=UPI00356251BC
MPLLFPSIIAVMLAAPLHADQARDELPVEVWSPAPREVPVDRFHDWPCDRLASAEAKDDREKAQLSDRKKACLQRYQQFIPGTGLR